MSNSSPVRIQSDDALQDQHGLSYSPALDGLRGVAILAVVGVNAEWPFLAGGFFGVDVFFVLSGFLITTLLLTEWKQRGEINLRRFFARRALRLMPALIALLAFSCIYTYFFRSPEQRGAAFTIVASALFYISNWVIGVGNVHGTLEHTWSLGVEGQFYLLGAGFIAFALRRAVGLSQMIGWCIGAIAVVVSWRAIFWEQAPGVMRVYMGLDTRADSLLIGCLVAFTRESKMGGAIFTLCSHARWLLPIAWLVLVVSFVATPGVGVSYPYLGGFTIVSLATAVILRFALSESRDVSSRLLSSPLLVWFGRISYSLYLWHVPLKNVFSVDRLVPYTKSTIAAEICRFAIFVGVACGSYYCIERPFLRLKVLLTDRPRVECLP